MLLWPQDVMWFRYAQADLMLPLRSRLSKVMFHMLLEAQRLLWPEDPPSLSTLLPEMQLLRQLPADVYVPQM